MYVSRRVGLAAGAALLLMTGACSANGRADASESHHVRLYGSDGNMGNPLGDALKDHPGALAGMKGTTPMTPLTDDFKNRLKAVYPNLDNFSYAGETYDAVVLAALAAETARTANPRTLAKFLPGVTYGGEACDTVSQCLRMIRIGTDIQYRGVSLRRGGFSDKGEPSTASYATMHFSEDNRIDDGKTEFVGAGNEGDTTKARQPAPPPGSERPKDAPLVLGGLLPETGALESQNPPLAAGARLAIREINAAGGVLGEPVKWIDGDDGTSGTKAKETAAKEIAQHVHVIIGASSSSVTKAVLPMVTNAGVVMISPCATADELMTLPDHGLFFRTAPPDHLQAKALADIVLRDGSAKVLIINRDDSWGNGLRDMLSQTLQAAGLTAKDVRVFTYPGVDSADEKLDLSSLPNQVKNFAPDGIVLLGFDETVHVIDKLLEGDISLQH
ncbi:MAG TPA: ABC transporter substrate-binding protein [Micromonosporaceae bacterium]|jgi:ABC-type branched-subunit amino acid transport system substrate-binding protein